MLEVLREPMLALLVGAGLIYLVLGDLKEAMILVIFAVMSVAITVIQETRTERVFEALRDLTSPRALVTPSKADVDQSEPDVCFGPTPVVSNCNKSSPNGTGRLQP